MTTQDTTQENLNNFKISVDSLKELTPAQKEEVKNAQKMAISENTGNKLDVLKKNISPETQKILDEKNPDWK